MQQLRRARFRKSRFFFMPMAVVVFVLVVGLFSGGVAAQVGGAFPQFSWGARYQASLMEGIPFNDGFGTLANPAAVRGCRSNHIAVQQVTPFEVPVTGVAWCTDNAVGGHLIVRQTPPGLNFDYNTYQLGLTGAFSVGRLTFGLTPKLLFLSISGTETGMDDTASGYSVDAGIGYEHPLSSRFFDRFTFDVSGLDALSRLQLGSGTAEPAAAPSYRAALGAAGARLAVGLVGHFVHGEADWRAGAEYTLFDSGTLPTHFIETISVRLGAGAEKVAFGIGLKLRGFGVDYAYRVDGQQSADDGAHFFSSGWHF